MARKYTAYSPEQKFRIALEASRNEKTVNQIASEYGVHACQVSEWKRQLMDSGTELFRSRRKRKASECSENVDYLQQQIGKLTVELDWLKKNMELPNRQKKGWIDADNNLLSLNNQLELLGLSKASYYYQPVPETTWNLELMAVIDKLYTDHPFYGSRRMRAELRERGHEVNRKRVIRLMQKMGLQAIYPKRNLSKAAENHVKYPYLLTDLTINRPNQVWATDITYIRVGCGYLYLTAVMDWHSRFVLSWRISNTLDVGFCLEALEAALEIGKPEIFNSDQGCQYTSKDFTGALKDQDIQISMDGKGRAFDNIFVERLWRSVKYEEVYLKRYETGREAMDGLNNYLTFYNNKRLHQALGYKTPRSLYEGEQRTAQ